VEKNEHGGQEGGSDYATVSGSEESRGKRDGQNTGPPKDALALIFNASGELPTDP